MADLTAPVLTMILATSPVLIPMVITAVHAIADWRRKAEPVAPVVNRERRASAVT